MREFTLVVLVLFLLSSANGQSQCPKSETQCERLTLDSIAYNRQRMFSSYAKCCVQTLGPADLSYSQHNGIFGLENYPPPVHRNDVRMSVYYSATNNYKPVVKLSWKYPLCRKGAFGIKGFNLNFMSKETGNYVEKRMLFSNIDMYQTAEDRLNIEYEFSDDLLHNNTLFSVVIGSLPEDSYSSQNNRLEVTGTTSVVKKKRNAEKVNDVSLSSGEKSSRLQRVVRVRRNNDQSNLQSEINTWQPEWRLFNKTEDGKLFTIKLEFKQASCEYNFDYYRLRISNCTEDKGSACKVFISKFYGEEKCDDDLKPCIMKEYKNTTITFRNIVPGNYQIIFQTSATNGAVDKKNISRNDFTRKPTIDFKGVPFPSPIPSTGPREGSSEQRRSDTGGSEIAAIIAGIAAALFLLVLIGGIGCFIKRRHKPDYMQPIPNSSTEDSIITNNRESSRPLERKRVTIVSSTDHNLHHTCVKFLVDFLKTNCWCDISWEAVDLLRLMRSKSGYILSSLDEDADFIMFIHSEGAYEKYMMLRDTDDAETYRSKEISVTGDFFVQAISSLKQLAVQNNKSKLINAHFSYTSKEHIIHQFQKDTPLYPLMDTIDQVCRQIHGLQEEHYLIKKLKDYEKLNYGVHLKDYIAKFKEMQKMNPNWFKEGHDIAPHGEVPRCISPREPERPTEQCDSGLGGETANSGVYYDNPSRDRSLDDSSLFPWSFDDGPDFVAPRDLHEGARPKVRNKCVNEKPLNNAAVPPYHSNGTNSRLTSPVLNSSNSPTLPLSNRIPRSEGMVPEPWGAHPAVHSYPNPSANNLIRNPQKPKYLPNSRNSSIRNSKPKRRFPSGGSNRSNISSTAPKSRNSSARSDSSDSNLLPSMYESATPNRNVPSFPSDGAGSLPRGSGAASVSSQPGPSEFEPPEDMSFCGPAMSEDTSSLDSAQMQLEIMQINDEFDFNNGGDSGTGSIDGEVRFHRPKDDFDQISV